MMVAIITSPQNPRIKAAAKLRDKDARREQNVFIVEGAREMARALQCGYVLQELYYCEDGLSPDAKSLLEQAAAQKVELVGVSAAAFRKLAVRESSDGVYAVFTVKQSTLDAVKGENPLIIVLETVEKPGNLGAVLRTADGAGAAVVVLDPSCDIYSPNVVRASLGALFSVPVVQCAAKEFESFCKSRGVKVIATTPHTSSVYFDADMRGPSAILMGSEAHGLSKHWLERADSQVKIPMLGIADSLNLSVAAAILVYEAVRQRR